MKPNSLLCLLLLIQNGNSVFYLAEYFEMVSRNIIKYEPGRFSQSWSHIVLMTARCLMGHFTQMNIFV